MCGGGGWRIRRPTAGVGGVEQGGVRVGRAVPAEPGGRVPRGPGPGPPGGPVRPRRQPPHRLPVPPPPRPPPGPEQGARGEGVGTRTLLQTLTKCPLEGGGRGPAALATIGRQRHKITVKAWSQAVVKFATPPGDWNPRVRHTRRFLSASPRSKGSPTLRLPAPVPGRTLRRIAGPVGGAPLHPPLPLAGGGGGGGVEDHSAVRAVPAGRGPPPGARRPPRGAAPPRHRGHRRGRPTGAPPVRGGVRGVGQGLGLGRRPTTDTIRRGCKCQRPSHSQKHANDATPCIPNAGASEVHPSNAPPALGTRSLIQGIGSHTSRRNADGCTDENSPHYCDAHTCPIGSHRLHTIIRTACTCAGAHTAAHHSAPSYPLAHAGDPTP